MVIPPTKKSKLTSELQTELHTHYPEKKRRLIKVEPSILYQYSDKVNINFRIFDSRQGRISNYDIAIALNKIAKSIKSRHNFKATENESNVGLAPDKFPVIMMETETLLKTKKSTNVKKTKILSQSDSTSLVGIRKISSEELVANQVASTLRVNTTMQEYAINQDTLKKVTSLRYRESVYTAASKLVKDMPPFPTWSYTDDDNSNLKTSKINVGGEIFKVFNSTVSSLSHTKIGKLFKGRTPDQIPFVDRDPLCFSAILNFFRTGRLHVPHNTCLTFFADELEFWGISENFLEACCWGDFYTYKVAGNKLKKYSEDSDKSMQKYAKPETGCMNDFKLEMFRTMTTGTGSLAARWVALLFAFFIISGIIVMILSTTPIGRINIITKRKAIFEENESVTHFLTKSKVNGKIVTFDLISSGFFVAELLLRFILIPVKLEFFRDTFNWIDLVATVTSLVYTILARENTHGKLQAFTFILKIPRIFRLLKLTAGLRSGIDAFVLTIFASAKELQLVFSILLVVTILFGCLIFAVEMHNPATGIKSLYIGMWFAIGTLPGVGYGDYIPITVFGQIIATVCILCGVLICQMPVPIFLKNFSVYYNQASARLISQSDLLLCENVDKSDVLQFETNLSKKPKDEFTETKMKTLLNQLF